MRRSPLLTRSSLADKKSVTEAQLKEKAETPAPKEQKLIQAPDLIESQRRRGRSLSLMLRALLLAKLWNT